MPVSAHTYKLGKDHVVVFPGISNIDVRDVTITRETSAEAEVTTRASDNISEFVPVRQNTSIEVTVLSHSTTLHATGALQLQYPTGTNYFTGPYYVNNISEPQVIDGAVEYTISLRRLAGV